MLIPECVRGSGGGGCDSLLKDYMKQEEEDRKERIYFFLSELL